MTREEKEKAIDALKISAPVIAVTPKEYNDYIQTLNKIMDWLEQEPCDEENGKDIEHEIKDLSERVENIEKQIIESEKEKIKKLKVELEYAKEYAKFRCALPTMRNIMSDN
jgi:vacuolar-type H+-ATPase subunit D/Vma8